MKKCWKIGVSRKTMEESAAKMKNEKIRLRKTERKTLKTKCNGIGRDSGNT